MTEATCTVEGCTRPHLAHGYCRRHYQHWYRNTKRLVSSMRWRRGRCRTCMHWNDAHAMDRPDAFGICALGWSSRGSPDTRTTLAYAVDDEAIFGDYPRGGVLLTAPSFGCVQYALTDKPPDEDV